ncbi:Dual specificity phosphatase, catalytic domain [Rubripirellula tenax]|uniref:Dual specificity phosphatase, catalytic domain n=1 Tax=Rubripirellula tenax TaxID=2528015 RepID=A0A5C6ENV2_9BACT|nr:dual specificity protein phosphatase family protein [Rubripirellula tenax]TWU50732.1 Dual specificity phosphatase, catalytic domain [Rubripirellula tenax]
MHELHPNLLWLGHAFDVREPRPLFDAGITAVVDVAFEEPPAQLPRQLLYLRFPLNDGGGNEPSVLRFAVQSLVDLLHSETRTIVACSAGMSRSPTIAAYALACHLDITPEVALERIAAIKSLEIKGQLWSDVAGVFPSVRRPTWFLR